MKHSLTASSCKKNNDLADELIVGDFKIQKFVLGVGNNVGEQVLVHVGRMDCKNGHMNRFGTSETFVCVCLISFVQRA